MEANGTKKRGMGFGSMKIKTKRSKVVSSVEGGGGQVLRALSSDKGRGLEEQRASGPMVIPLVKNQIKTEEESIAAELAAEARGKMEVAEHRRERVIKIEDSVVAKGKPLLAASKLPGLDGISDERERLRKDLSLRAADCGLKTYDHVPVEDFGAALLRGMGWNGKIDKDKNFDPKLRHHRLGLGAEPKPNDIFDKKGAPRKGKTLTTVDKTQQKKKEWLGAAPRMQAESTARSLLVGDLCTGMRGFVGAEKIVDQVVRVNQPVDELRPNHAIVDFRGRRISVPARALRYTPNASFDNSSSQERAKKKKKATLPTDNCHDGSEVPKSWLCTDIRVRVAKRSHPLFRRKAHVIDVFREESLLALLRFDDGRTLELGEKYLETVLPKQDNTRVTILVGPSRGRQATLLRRDTSKQLAFVQLLQPDAYESIPSSAATSAQVTAAQITLSFDYIAESVL